MQTKLSSRKNCRSGQSCVDSVPTAQKESSVVVGDRAFDVWGPELVELAGRAG